MFSKSFVAIAMLGFVFTATTFGQKEIVIWTKAQQPAAKQFTGSDEELGALIAWMKAQPTTKNKAVKRSPQIKSPRDVSTGQALDNGGVILGEDVQKKPQANGSQRPSRKPKAGNLIDTSTGEIVWADEVKATPHSKTIQRPKGGNLIDTSTGEIVWAKGNNPNSSNARKTPRASQPRRPQKR